MTYGTLREAIEAAHARQQAAQCAIGRHVYGCPHRVSPWVRRATVTRDLPTFDRHNGSHAYGPSR